MATAVILDEKSFRRTIREELERIHQKRPDRRTSDARAADAKLGLDWLSNEEAQRITGLSRATLARYRADGTLPYSKLGQNIFYRRSEIDRILAEREVQK